MICSRFHYRIGKMEGMCRICLNQFQLPDLKDFEHSFADGLNYIDLFEYCISIALNQLEDNLPLNLCTKCEENLLNSYEFKRQCLYTESILQNLFNDKPQTMETSTENDLPEKIKNDKSLELDKDEDGVIADCSMGSIITENEVSLGHGILDKSESASSEALIPVNDTLVPIHILNEYLINENESILKILRNENEISSTPNVESNVFWEDCSMAYLVPDEYEFIIGGGETDDSAYAGSEEIIPIKENLFDWEEAHLDEYSLSAREDSHQKLDEDNNKKSANEKTDAILTSKSPKKRERKAKKKNESEVRTAISNMELHATSASTRTPYSCTICSKAFKTKKYLRRHTRKHTGANPFKCAYCEKLFLYWTTRSVHQIKCHSGEYPFNCSLCDMKFCRKSGLSKHMISHTGLSNNFKKCDQCDYICDNLYTLKLHKTVHSDKREVKCDLCDNTYKTAKALRVHMRKHSGKRDYLCPVCAKTFTTSPILRSHVQRMHPEVMDVMPPPGTILNAKYLKSLEDTKHLCNMNRC